MINPNYYLAASSSLFLAPTLYGLYRGHTILPLVSLIATSASVNYWLDPSNPHKKNIDLFASKSCGLLYFIYGYQTMESIDMRLIGYTNIFMILTTYQASCIMYNNENNNMWVPMHIMFHYLASMAKFFVLSR